MDILYKVLLIYIGVIIGVIIGYLFRVWVARRSTAGTIHISQEQEKTVYLLELENYPDEIRFQKEVVFKVDASEIEKLDRD